jgi:hypothetical protein
MFHVKPPTIKETTMTTLSERSPHPAIAEQIEAVSILRNFALIVPRFVNPTAGELAVARAINDLDNADLFAALDEARDNLDGAPAVDPAEWGDTTREDMARHQQADICRCGGSFSGEVGGIGCSCGVGLPELKEKH